MNIHNKMGIYHNTYDGMTYDWIFILKKNKLDLYRAEGLRNFPIKNVNIVFKSEVELAKKFLPRVHPPDRILSVSLRDFNDKISFYGINKSNQIIKYRRDINLKQAQKEWSFRNILTLKHSNITDLLVHPDYPISLNLTANNELLFYFEEQSNSFNWAIHKNFKFIGQYSHTQDIKQIKFIDKIPGVLILNENSSMTIVCSDTFLKVLGSHKYSREFLQIWDRKKNNSYEKWVMVDEYDLVDSGGLEKKVSMIGKVVHSMQIVSSHFDQSQAKIKILFFYDTKYSVMDIVIKLSTFREFIVEISQLSTIKYGFVIDRIWTDSKTKGNNVYAFAKISSSGRQKSFKNTLMKVKIDEKETKDEFSVLWKTETLKTDNIRTILGANYLGVINDDEGIVYIFELFEERYSGYIDLNKAFPNIKGNSQEKESAYVSDLLFCRDHAKGSLIVYYKDSVLLFSQINTEHLDSYQDEAWTMIHKFDGVLNLDVIKSVKMVESYYGQLMFIINKKYFLSRNRFLTKIDHSVFTLHNKENNAPQNVTFEGLFTIFQESKPIYHPQLLKQFYIKGHINLVLKILVKIYKLLQFDTKKYKIPSLCEFSLQEIINELQIDKIESNNKEQP